MSLIDRLSTLLPAAADRARARGRSVLVSAVERVDPIDVLDVAMSPTASTHDRMFWARRDVARAGIGIARDFRASGESRFATIDAAWHALLEDALIDDAGAEREARVAPMVMGGFAFDPDGPRSAPWRDFPAASMFLPRLQIVTREETCWLTANVLVAPDGSTDASLEDVAALWEAVRAGARDASRSGPAVAELAYADARSPDEWRELVQRAVDAIRAGDMEKVVLAREVRGSIPGDLDLGETLRYLREVHPTCYVFACWRADSVFLGATPELLVQLDGNEVRASALAGSVRRGIDGDADETFTRGLMESAKDRAEHEVVRHRLCATLGELCTHITWTRQPHILTLANVHHLHTPVVATLREGGSLLQLVARLHPTPAVGGEPRDAALRFIHEQEELDRGWYAAPIGWMQGDVGVFAVALRSALLAGHEASLFAGCGIVAASDPEREYVESMIKLRPMKLALAAALESSARESEASDHGSEDASSRANAVSFVERAS